MCGGGSGCCRREMVFGGHDRDIIELPLRELTWEVGFLLMLQWCDIWKHALWCPLSVISAYQNTCGGCAFQFHMCMHPYKYHAQSPFGEFNDTLTKCSEIARWPLCLSAQRRNNYCFKILTSFICSTILVSDFCSWVRERNRRDDFATYHVVKMRGSDCKVGTSENTIFRSGGDDGGCVWTKISLLNFEKIQTLLMNAFLADCESNCCEQIETKVDLPIKLK